MGWWVIEDNALFKMLVEVQHGRSPDIVFIEHYANSEHQAEQG
jgi:hypothetical protein